MKHKPLPQRIEEASLRAWPALRQNLLDGWILRFAKGYTKRANSITPLDTSLLDIERKIGICEDLYASEGLTPIFRLLSFIEDSDLDSRLSARGYERKAETSVLLADLETLPANSAAGDLHTSPDSATWVHMFHDLSEKETEGSQIHQHMLEKIAHRTLFAELRIEGEIVACGLGVCEEDLFGLFDLVTRRSQRRKGYGAALVSAMCSRARRMHCRHAYLQVVNDNEPAYRLYSKLGFQKVYGYHYRVK